MAEGQADRGVVMRLRVVVDENAPAAVQQWGGLFAEMNKRVEQSALATGRRITEGYRQAAEQGAPGFRQPAPGDGAPGAYRRPPRPLGPDREAAREAGQAQAATARAQAEQKRRMIDTLRQQDREAGQAQAATARATRERDREAIGKERAIVREAAAQDKAGRAADRTALNIVRANTRVAGSLTNAAGCALQLAKGLAFMGIAGEENTAKLMQGLLVVQGGFDAVSGAIRMGRSLSLAWQGSQRAILAAGGRMGAAAIHGVAAGTVQSAVGGVVGGAAADAAEAAGSPMIEGATAGVTHLAVGKGVGKVATKGNWMARGVTGAAKFAGRAATGTAAKVAWPILAAAGTVWAGSKIAERYDPTEGKVPEGWLGRGGMGFGASIYGRLGGVAESMGVQVNPMGREYMALRQTSLATERATERDRKRREAEEKFRPHREYADKAREIREAGELEAMGSRSELRKQENLAQARKEGYRPEEPLRVAEAAGEQISARQSREAQERAVADIDRRRPGAGLGNQHAEERQRAVEELNRRKEQEGDADTRQRQAEEQMRQAGDLAAKNETGAAGVSAKAAAEEEAARSKYARRINDRRDIMGPDEGRNLREDLEAKTKAAKASLDIWSEEKQDRNRAEREFAQQRIGAGEKAVELGRQEIALRRQAVEAARGRLGSAAESFGAMNRGDMGQADRAVQRAREGGRLTEDQLGMLDRIGTDEAKRAAADYRKKEAYKFYGGGEEGRKKFEEKWGRTEGETIKREEAAIKPLEVDVRNQELKLNVDRSKDSAIVENLTRTVTDLILEQNREIVEEVGRRVEREIGRVWQAIEAAGRRDGDQKAGHRAGK